MNKRTIYPKDWMKIHPYKVSQPSDAYFTELANRIYSACLPDILPETLHKRLSLYASAYLEDIVSGLGLWKAFTTGHRNLYGKTLPFYDSSAEYFPEEVNEADIRFLIWNTWQKSSPRHDYINPKDKRIADQAQAFLPILEKAYEEAPENNFLENYFSRFDYQEEADRKLTWLFGHTYLTEPSMLPYIGQVTPHDRFIIPTGPLALFLHEWIELLSGSAENWKTVSGLYPAKPALPEPIREKHEEMYRNFLQGTHGKTIVYLKGYEVLRQFLTGILKWPDDDEHTLPQLKPEQNFILMTKRERGILLAKNICEFIADTDNPLYDPEKAQKNAFRLLTEEMLCPPDLLTYCIQHKLIPDARLPEAGEKELVQQNADFIARHSLLYYYRGD